MNRLQFKATNVTQLNDLSTFNFIRVEETPLMSSTNNAIIIAFSSLILAFGILINGRIFNILSNHSDAAAFDKLLKTNTIISLFMHCIILTYYIATSFVYPMTDYIGLVGCLLVIHLLDVFARFYNFVFPVAIALLRYLFVVKSFWVKAVGMKKVVNRVLAFSFIIPLLMTLFVQFPIFDGVHGPFNRCIGRFETVFSPLDPDPITPGLRGGLTQCPRVQRWAMDPKISKIEYLFRMLLLCGCLISTGGLRTVLLSVPEIILYSLTFAFIIKHTDQTAASGILRAGINFINFFSKFSAQKW